MICMAFAANAQVLISEIMYNPPESGNDSLEYIELYNNSAGTVDLTGWQFTQGVTHTFGQVVLQPQGRLIVCINENAYRTVFGNTGQIVQWTSGALNNTGETIEIADPGGLYFSAVTYSNGAGGWFSEADGNGASVELCDPNRPINDVNNWKPATNALGVEINGKQLLGTPGAANTVVCSFDPDAVVEVGDFFFSPADITIDEGQTIRWINTGGHHNVNGSTATFPANPEGFFSGTPSMTAWTYDFTFHTPGLYRYQCDAHAAQMQGTVTVRSTQVQTPEYAIGQVRGVNSEGIADSIGVQCYLKGIVYGVNQRDPGLQFTLIDQSGDGIGVFSASNSFGYTVQEGDELRVLGTLEQFRGLLQINISGLQVISTGNNLLNPVEVEDLNEDTESRLIKIRSVTVVDAADWTNNPAGFNVRVTNGSQEFIMRVARNVSVGAPLPPGYPFDLTGIGGQFDSSEPLLDGYQILPRYERDIDGLASTKDQSLDKIARMWPNPVRTQLSVAFHANADLIQLVDAHGRLCRQWLSPGQQTQLELNGIQPGLYIVRIQSQGNWYSGRVIVVQ